MMMKKKKLIWNIVLCDATEKSQTRRGKEKVFVFLMEQKEANRDLQFKFNHIQHTGRALKLLYRMKPKKKLTKM